MVILYILSILYLLVSFLAVFVLGRESMREDAQFPKNFWVRIFLCTIVAGLWPIFMFIVFVIFITEGLKED
jgi:hypothetical protein